MSLHEALLSTSSCSVDKQRPQCSLDGQAAVGTEPSLPPFPGTGTITELGAPVAPLQPCPHDLAGVKPELSEADLSTCCACVPQVTNTLNPLPPGGPIRDQYIVRVCDMSWHAHCLRCHVCERSLADENACRFAQDRPVCRQCYAREYGARCARCGRCIQPTDWVRRARQLVYHLACFACDACKRQLSTGEHFALQDCRVLCKQHYMELVEGDCGSPGGSASGARAKCKRVRTTFSDEQLQILQANFMVDSNPDGQDLERIAQITGLSKRVTQVWFQNSRARQKKYQSLKHRAGGAMTPSIAGGQPGSEISDSELGTESKLDLDGTGMNLGMSVASSDGDVGCDLSSGGPVGDISMADLFGSGALSQQHAAALVQQQDHANLNLFNAGGGQNVIYTSAADEMN